MKTQIQPLLLAASMLAASISPVRAQIVADGATRTLINETNTFPGDVTVGTNGSFTLLVLSDNALLTNSANGLIGRNAGANSNEVRLISASARWLMGGSLFVGNNGAANRLVVSNGGTVLAGSSSTIGYGGDFSGNANSNTVTVSGAGSLWSNGLELVVGELGFANRLEVNNGGRVLNSNAFVGRSFFSPSNTVVVTGTGSLWSNRADVSVGGAGSGNLLVVSNGGWVVNSNASVGLQSAGNLALVTGINSTWSNRADLYVGNGARGNQLVVSDGAVVRNNNGYLGVSAGSSSNVVVVTGPGSVWSNANVFYLGFAGAGNQLVVSNAGHVETGLGAIGQLAASSNNMALITGAGSHLKMATGSLEVGSSGGGNRLVVSDGGLVDGFEGIIGTSSSNNEALVTGAGSLWDNLLLHIGSSGSGNRLTITNGGQVSVRTEVIVGRAPSSTNNRVTVDGGTLRVTNAPGTGVLDVRRGTNVLNAGLIEADYLIVTNTAGKFELNGGTLVVKNTTVANQQLFRVGNGVSPATFTLVGNGTHTFVNGLTISANAALTGNGTIGAVTTVLSGGTLGPGTSIGNIVLGFPPSLQGAVLMELSKNGAALTNDQIQVTGTLTYGGALIVTNLGPTALAAGDKFQLFNATTYAGSFTSMTLPPLAPGLEWRDNLLVDGAMWAAPASAWRSTLYPPDWQPPTNGAVYFETNKLIQDFSYAGYKAGEASLPVIAGPVFNVTQSPYNADKTGATNATTAIQSAINAAQAGGGGVVLVPAGLYSISPQGANAYALTITSSNVVLRGAGVGVTFLLNTTTNMRSKSIILLSGSSSAGFYSSGAASTLITQDLLGPATEIPVASTSGFATGQWVVVRADCTDAWITEHNEPDWIGYGSQLGGVAYFRRVVAVSVPANKITIKAPTRYYLKTRDNARVVRLSAAPLLGCGLEDFSIGNVQHNGTGFGENDYTVSGTAAYDVHDSFAIRIVRARDSWIRNVATFQPAGNTTTAHLLSNGILLLESSQITLTNCDFGHAQYGGGGNGYQYRLQNANECLLDNCRSTFTRHGFVLSHMASSGNVYHECTDKDSGRQTGDTGLQTTAGSNSDHHMHFSHGNLIDTCTGDNSGFEARYRPYGSAPLHDLTAAHSVFWNTRGINGGPSYIVTTEQSRYGYVIGTRGTRSGVSLSTYGGTKCDPLDHVEGTGLGDTLEPFSLYQDQLNRRLSLPVGPQFTSITLSGTNVVLSGTNGTPNGSYAVLTATNIVLPLSNWVSLVTNQFDSSGNFSFTNAIAPGIPQRFYRIRTP